MATVDGRACPADITSGARHVECDVIKELLCVAGAHISVNILFTQ